MLAAGRKVFLDTVEPQGAVCHALAEVGSTGEIVGSNLDALTPGAARVHAAVARGAGVMPAYNGVLTPEQIDAVAVYVAGVAAGATSE